MKRTRIAKVIASEDIGSVFTVMGWVRTKRESKGGFCFIEVNDGSCLASLQVIAGEHLPNYRDEVARLQTGCAVRVKGKLDPVQIFALLGRVADVRDEDLDYARRFDEAVQHFQSREWPLALRQFESLAKLRPADVAAETYRSATALLIARPPDAGWNGAIELAEK